MNTSDNMKPEANKNLLYTMFSVLVLKGDDQPSWEKVRAAFLDVNFMPQVGKINPLELSAHQLTTVNKYRT